MAGSQRRKEQAKPKPKSTETGPDRDREQREPSEPLDEFVTDAEIEAREFEQRKRKGRSKSG
jgi:hypothetical protein